MRTLNEIFYYDGNKIYASAEQSFIRACGFNIEEEKHRKMLSDGIKALHKNKKNIYIKGIYSMYDSEIYGNNKIAIEGVEITCNGFSKINSQYVVGICFAIITAGDWKNEGGIKEQLYMDTWGTAFVDGARAHFEDGLRKGLKADEYLSDPFGPGYYGMPTDDTKKFKRLLDLEKIGVDIRDSGIMVPEKTIAAVYLITNNKDVFSSSSCAECLGALGGCKYCSNYRLNKA